MGEDNTLYIVEEYVGESTTSRWEGKIAKSGRRSLSNLDCVWLIGEAA
jgi:hypothetical protein